MMYLRVNHDIQRFVYRGPRGYMTYFCHTQRIHNIFTKVSDMVDMGRIPQDYMSEVRYNLEMYMRWRKSEGRRLEPRNEIAGIHLAYIKWSFPTHPYRGLIQHAACSPGSHFCSMAYIEQFDLWTCMRCGRYFSNDGVKEGDYVFAHSAALFAAFPALGDLVETDIEPMMTISMAVPYGASLLWDQNPWGNDDDNTVETPFDDDGDAHMTDIE